MITAKIEQALYIKDLIFEKKSIKVAMGEESQEDVWVESANSLPDHFHSENEPNYMELLMGLSGFDCQEDAPYKEIEVLREYINKKISDKVIENMEFMKLRTISLKSNIKYLKDKFEKDWKQSYKEALLEDESENEVKDKGTVKNLDMDDILDKINKKGMKSLTEEEKKFLKLKGGDKK
jgi:hypothetical protein